jgi:hypothetical protein
MGPIQPPVQWMPGVLSQGLKCGRGVTLTTHPPLVPRSGTSSPPRAFRTCSGTLLYIQNFTGNNDRVIAQAVSRRPLTAEARLLPGLSMRNLWWKKWHYYGFFSEFYCFPLSISFHRRSPTHIIWRMKNMFVSGSSSET